MIATADAALAALQQTGGVILAGGRSTRMGSAKAFVEVGGVPLIERVLACHRSVLASTVIVTNDPPAYEHLGVATVTDLHPRRGPLAGLHAGLSWAAEIGLSGVLCTPCDAPFFAPSLARLLVSASGGHQAVLPRSHGPLSYEPQFAWYSVEAFPIAAACLSTGRRALWQFVEALTRVRYLPLAAIAEVGDPDLLFSNINTPNDLSVAQRFVAGSEP